MKLGKESRWLDLSDKAEGLKVKIAPIPLSMRQIYRREVPIALAFRMRAKAVKAGLDPAEFQALNSDNAVALFEKVPGIEDDLAELIKAQQLSGDLLSAMLNAHIIDWEGVFGADGAIPLPFSKEALAELVEALPLDLAREISAAIETLTETGSLPGE